jgi:hypothetical protein
MRLSGTRGADSDKSSIAWFDEPRWSNAQLDSEPESTHDSAVESDATAGTLQPEL